MSKSVYQTPTLQFERNPGRLGFSVTYSRLECPATIRVNQSVDQRTDVFQGRVNKIRENIVSRFMVVKVFTCATVRRRIHPSKARNFPKNRPNNLRRSPLHLGCHKKEGSVVRNTLPTPAILAHKHSALFWVVDVALLLSARTEFGAYLSIEHAAVCLRVLCRLTRLSTTVSAASCVPKRTTLKLRRGPPGGPYPHTTLSPLRVNRRVESR